MSNVGDKTEILLADAVTDCLNNAGIAILRNPQQFVSLLNDVCGNRKSMETEVLLHNCDGGLLRFFAEATSIPCPSVANLQEAALATSTFLQGDCSVAPEIANAIADQLLAGIVRYLDGKVTDSPIATTVGDLPTNQITERVRSMDTIPTEQEVDTLPKERAGTMTLSDFLELHEEDACPLDAVLPGQEVGAMKAPVPFAGHESEPKMDDDSLSGSEPASPTVTSGRLASGAVRNSKRQQSAHIIVAVALVAIAVIVLSLSFVSSRRKVIALFDTDNGKTVTQEIKGWRGGTVVLPGPFVENDDCVFAGWISADASDVNDVLEPGAEVEVDDYSSYHAVWNPLVSFDGNGADQGSMEPVVVKYGERLKLPESEYTKKGYVFSGWSTDKDGGLIEPSDYEPFVHEPMTYYAIWAPQLVVGHASIKDLSGVSGTIEGWDSAMGVAALVVTNDTDQTLEVEATITELDKSGSKLADDYSYCNGVGPGDSRLFFLYSMENSAAKATYGITVEPDSYNASISSHISDEVVSVDKNKLCIKVTNTGDAKINIGNIGLVAVDDLGAQYVASSFNYVDLEPGESLTVTFDKDSMIAYNQKVPDWTRVEYSLYVDGCEFIP